MNFGLHSLILEPARHFSKTRHVGSLFRAEPKDVQVEVIYSMLVSNQEISMTSTLAPLPHRAINIWPLKPYQFT